MTALKQVLESLPKLSTASRCVSGTYTFSTVPRTVTALPSCPARPLTSSAFQTFSADLSDLPPLSCGAGTASAQAPASSAARASVGSLRMGLVPQVGGRRHIVEADAAR